MLALHATWTNQSLFVWAERAITGPAPVSTQATDEAAQTSSDAQGDGESQSAPKAAAHPGSVPASELREQLRSLGSLMAKLADGADEDEAPHRLPTLNGLPMPSPGVDSGAFAAGSFDSKDDDEELVSPRLEAWQVSGLVFEPRDAPHVLTELEDMLSGASDLPRLGEASGEAGAVPVRMIPASDLRFFAAASRFAWSLLAQHRFVPALIQQAGRPLRGVWQPWLNDEGTSDKARVLLGAMPASARACDDEMGHDAGLILQDFLLHVTDHTCRTGLSDDGIPEAIEDKDPQDDQHVAWLTGLLRTQTASVESSPGAITDLVRKVRVWVGGLDDRGQGGEWRLLLQVEEPLNSGDLADLAAPTDDMMWSVRFQLQSKDNESVIIDAEDIWSIAGASASIEGHRVDHPHDLLLAELGRASRVYSVLEKALRESEPMSLALSTRQAYQFLREYRPVLIEQGFAVQAPEWWDTPGARLGARLQIDPAGPLGDPDAPGAGAPGVNDAKLGLSALVNYQWRIAVGQTTLTLKEFEQLANTKSPLVRVGNQWVEVRPEDVQAAMRFIGDNPGGQMRVGEAMRIAFAAGLDETGVPVMGIDATGWLSGLLDQAEGEGKMPMIDPPDGFMAQLRPYQRKGLSWLAFLDRIGLGPCLADDMGLGKTIQMLALLSFERDRALHLPDEDPDKVVGPTLIIVPMSIVDNWKREAEKFSPNLKLLVHHGVERVTGEAFTEKASSCDIVVTTYALAHRDREQLETVEWHRVVLDEAQNIKNPQAKQSQAVRAFKAPRRVVLTGTPLENRLSELWSVMDFCNPGLLGGAGEFRRNFAVPIERYHDRAKSERLRGLVRPFILRRLKTDPNVISDLPEKVETKEFCRLTSEQATLYENTVKTMLGEVERAEGIKRRGVVLTTLIRLKQICNHPAQMLKDEELEAAQSGGPVNASRSGKCVRLLELLEEVLASDEQALVFTQFRQMGTLLQSMLRNTLGREVLFLHGGTPQKQRQVLIDRFQKRDGKAPIFVLSLKAGGVGLNLTAASHVFHFDRWWNPAVENQATDRAFRIGQTRTVNVHKFIVAGTLEDRIDQMIESKMALADDIIGAGEDWLTELDVSQLRDVLTLRPDAAVTSEEEALAL